MRRAIAVSIVDQGLVSAFNLALNVALVALAGASEFGRFVLPATVLIVLTSLQNALVSTPLAIGLSTRSPQDGFALASALTRIDATARLSVAPIIFLGLYAASWDLTHAGFGLAYVLAGMKREWMRSVFAARERMTDCLRADAAATVIGGAAIAVLWTFLSPSSAALAGATIGAVASLVLFSKAGHPDRMGLQPAVALYRREVLRDSRWSLAGAAASEGQYRAYVFVIEALRDTAALGAVQAGRILMGPLGLVAGAWGRVARPRIAALLAEGRRREAALTTLRGLALVHAIGLAFFAAIYASWDIIEATLFRGRYPEIATLTAAFAAHAVVQVSQICLSVHAQAAQAFRSLFVLASIAAVATTAALILLMSLPISQAPLATAAGALLLGETLILIGTLRIVIRDLTGSK